MKLVEIVPIAAMLSVFATPGMSQPSKNAVRDVTPSGVSKVYRGERDQGPHNGAPKNEPIRGARVQPDGGIRQRDGSVFQLYGIQLPYRGKICQSVDAKWPCGNAAFIALANLVQGKDLVCEATADEATLRCRADSIDPSLRMLEIGYATLQPDVTDPAYLKATISAQLRKVGLWSERLPQHSR